MTLDLPRVVVAGLAGDTGKSLVSIGLVRALRRRGLSVAPFKKGPDFIDAAWLGAAAGRPGRNLDTFMMSEAAIRRSLWHQARTCDVAVVEGNRGLFDGMDARGSHSTAELAKAIEAPVVLVVDASKVTRTVAALVKGCQVFDPRLDLAGGVLNRCGTARQERVIREAVATDVGLPVLGALPRLESQYLPGRHLGLVPAAEHPGSDEIADALASIVEQRTDVPKILALAGRASRPQADPALEGLDPPAGARPGRRVRIGVLRDRAFSFYYPENLEALETAGGQLVFISPLDDESVPDIEALYAGGGFPEVHAAGLSENRSMRDSLRTRIAEGLPVWAECGGLMYLSRFIDTNGARYPMVGAVPCLIEQTPRPQGHGYVEASVDRVNPFLAEGVSLKGHEFHYSHVIGNHDDLATVMAVHRGIGVGNGRDGIRVGNVVASYTHLHSLGVPSLAGGIVSAALGGVA